MYLIKMYQLFFLNLCIYDIIDITSCSPRHGNSAQSKILLWEWEIRGQKNKAVKKKKNRKSLAVSGLAYTVQASLDKHLYDLILTINGLVFPAGALWYAMIVV